MRKANVSDMFKIGRLVTKLGIKEQIYEAQKGKGVDKLEEIGFDLIYMIFEKAVSEEVEDEIYDILSGPFETPKEDIEKMTLNKLLEGCTKVFDLKTVINFISRALPMIKN